MGSGGKETALSEGKRFGMLMMFLLTTVLASHLSPFLGGIPSLSGAGSDLERFGRIGDKKVDDVRVVLGTGECWLTLGSFSLITTLFEPCCCEIAFSG